MIIDLFAGPGGWDEGLRMLGTHDVVGIEIDHDPCLTASAAGHERWMLDVLDLSPYDFDDVHEQFDLQGLVASPPCPAFSQGGEGHGRKEDVRRAMLDFIYSCGEAGDWIEPPGYFCDEDIRADLTLQPLRWAIMTRPTWLAFEQVPAVETHWYAMAEILAYQFGYNSIVRVMNFANYGLPQFRERAILLASLDIVPNWPIPTHQDLRHHDSLFDNLEPWASVGDALKVKGDDPILQRPAATVTGGGGKDNGTGIFLDKRFRNALRVALDRPTGGVLRPWEAGVLQGFPTDYPWRGFLGSQYMQIGNAMPPTMAALLLEQFVR